MLEFPVPTPVATAINTSQELVRFLLARVSEDESALKRLARGDTGASGEIWGIPRLQAELAAKRRLIGALQQLVVLRDQPAERAVRHQAGQMLRFMALPYEQHEAFRAEWRPAGSH